MSRNIELVRVQSAPEILLEMYVEYCRYLDDLEGNEKNRERSAFDNLKKSLNGNGRIYFIKKRKECIGFAIREKEEINGDIRDTIRDLYIDYRFRRKGYGTEAMDRLLSGENKTSFIVIDERNESGKNFLNGYALKKGLQLSLMSRDENRTVWYF